MNVAIVGSGQLGQAVRRALAERGVSSELHSRATGFDVLSTHRDRDLGPVEAIVEATDIFTQNAKAAKEFFTRSTRSVNAACRASGGARHILVSIVSCNSPELRSNGYYAGKAEQERVARAENSNLTIIRSTLWFEFARQNLDRMKWGPVALVPSMTVQPVALDAVAQVVAQAALGELEQDEHEVAGPEVTTLWDMTKQLPDKNAWPLPLRVPGRAGRAFRSGVLLPRPDTDLVGPAFSDWLNADHALRQA